MLGPGRHPTRSGLTAHSRIHLFVCGALVRSVSGGPNWQSSAREPRSHRNPIERSTSEMTTNVLVTFYSTYGHVHRMALAVAEGAESVPDSTVRLRRIAELEEAALSAQDAYVRGQQAQANIPWVTHDDLRWADGIAWGTPTRYGNMSAQMKQFVDTTGGLWLKVSLRTRPPGFSRAQQPSTGARRR